MTQTPKNGMRPVHPGEVLREDYLVPLGTSVDALAKALSVPTPRRRARTRIARSSSRRRWPPSTPTMKARC
jgi:antitoxin HigA-1